ncbi:MAG: adenylyl-sulfate kinase [Patescibacteria group bacterium]
MIYWFTGQPGHGKTTLGKKIKAFFESKQNPRVIHIDTDDLRRLTSNFDYSLEGRRNNITLAQQIAHFLHDQDYIVIVSLVAPFRELREKFKKETECREIYVFTTEIRGRESFHGDYEKPLENFLFIDTTNVSPEKSLQSIIEHFRLM